MSMASIFSASRKPFRIVFQTDADELTLANQMTGYDETFGAPGSFNFKRCSNNKQFKCRGYIFSHVQPFYEQAVSDLDP